MITFKVFQQSLINSQGDITVPVVDQVRIFEQAHYQLERFKDNGQIFIIDPMTGEQIMSYKDTHKPKQHFRNKTLHSVESVSDLDVLLSGYDKYQIFVDAEFTQIVAEMNPTKGKMVSLLIKNIKGKNTGVISKEHIRQTTNKNYHKVLKELIDSCFVRVISNDISNDYITYQLPPYYVFKGSDSARQYQTNDWIDYSRSHNDKLIKSLPESEREQYQKYTAQDLSDC